MVRSIIVAIAAIQLANTAQAQTYIDAVRRFANVSGDLTLPTETSDISLSGSPQMAIYKPSGDGPFAAVVILPSCGGLRTEILDWAKRTVARGYVAFVVDPITQRGPPVCVPNSPSNHYRGTKDAFQALLHLKRFPFVDQERIGLLGFSWGAMVGLLVSSKTFAELFSPAQRFVATVGLYPLCHVDPMQGRPSVDFVRPDHDRPALILLADQDVEAPSADCVSLMQPLAEKGLPIDWYIYKGATHCWDCRSMDNHAKTDFRGVRVVYKFDKELTEDSAKRVFEYLDARLRQR